jgi:quercetin dioxygenase-like cupin family protein
MMSEVPFLGEPAVTAALYLAGALPAPEQAAFEAYLVAGGRAYDDALREMGAATVALGRLFPAPPVDPALRDALLRRIASSGCEQATPLRRQLQSREAAPAGYVLRRADEGGWEDTAVPGVRVRVLSTDAAADRFTALVRMRPGAAYPAHRHASPEECFVLEGDLCHGSQVMRAGDYQLAPAGSDHGPQATTDGCLLLIHSSLSDVQISCGGAEEGDRIQRK